MKSLAILIISVLLLSGCKYLEKKRLFSKGADTLLNYTDNQTDYDDPDLLSEYEDPIPEPIMAEPLAQPSLQVSGKMAYMVVGAFMIPQNAERYAEKVRKMGFSPEVMVRQDGYHLVIVGSYDDVKSGVNELNRFRDEISENAWVYVKR